MNKMSNFAIYKILSLDARWSAPIPISVVDDDGFIDQSFVTFFLAWRLTIQDLERPLGSF